MRKCFGAMLVMFVAVAVAVIPTALGASPNPQVIITKNCPAAANQKTYKGNVIVYVSGNGCVSIDKGATAIASGNATVVAHGDSTVYATGHVVLVVYNRLVHCKIGAGVTLINSSSIKSKYLLCQH